MINGRILIIDDVHPLLTEGLEAMGLQVDYRPLITRNEILDVVGVYQGLVVRSKTPIDSEILDCAAALNWIARAGSGIENIDATLAREKAISIFSAPEGNAAAVGEMAVGLLLALLRNIVTANNQVKGLKWLREENRGIELNELTVGIWGYGNTGSAFGRALSGFGCKILAYDKYKSGYGHRHVKECTAAELMSEADIISFHIPLTNETADLINTRFLNEFSRPMYLLNLSRGGIARTSDILEALENGILKGCALDVLEIEDFSRLDNQMALVYSKLMARNDVILTPHVAGWTQASYRKISSVLLHKIKGFYGVNF